MHACADCVATLPPVPAGKKRCPTGLAIHDRKPSYCRDCSNAYRRSRYSPEESFEWNLRYRYNSPIEEYNLLLTQQGGVCAICKQPETAIGRSGKVKTLATDHDHETGKVRGLLCAECNTLLGAIENDPVRFEALMKYKQRHSVNYSKTRSGL